MPWRINEEDLLRTPAIKSKIGTMERKSQTHVVEPPEERVCTNWMVDKKTEKLVKVNGMERV